MNSKIILGTVQFGLNYGINNTNGKPEPIQVFEILEKAATLGVKILDTADVYGNATELIGNFFLISDTRFEINTKFKIDKTKTLEDQFYESINKLRIDKLNTYFFHTFQEMLDYPDTLSKLSRLKTNSKISQIGVSVYTNNELKIAIDTPEIDVIQMPFNLLDNLNHRGILIEEAKSKGKEIQVRSIFLQGLFFKEKSEIPNYLFPLIPYLNSINEISTDHKIPIETLALAYAINHSNINNVLIGVDNIEQLERNLLQSKQTITYDIIEKVNAIKVIETELLNPKNWK